MKLKSLSNYTALLEQAMHDSYITDKDMLSLNEWRTSPTTWGKTVGESAAS